MIDLRTVLTVCERETVETVNINGLELDHRTEVRGYEIVK
jgi:hypothetical protein